MFLLVLSIGYTQDLTLRPHDRVRVSSTGPSSISGDWSLSSEGSVKLGQGLVASLAGRTLSEAAREIQRVVGPGAGSVGMELLSPLEGSISFRGAVRRSGSIALRSPKTLTEILGIAEPTDSADLSQVLVVSGNGKTMRVDAERQVDFSMRPGDQVVVMQSTVPNEVLVLGAVKKPGSIPFKSPMTLEVAVALAGGITGHAVLSEISVLRKDVPVPGATWTEQGRQTQLLRGDVVRIASQENGRYVSVLGHVKVTGLVPYREGMTLVEAIEEAGGLVAGAG